MIQITFLTQRIGRVLFFAYFFPHYLLGIVCCKENQLASVRKQGVDSPVTQLENTLHNILLNIHNLTSLRTFLDHCLELFFGNFTFRGTPDLK